MFGNAVGIGAAQAGFNMLGSLINNGISAGMGDYNRSQNFLYNEKSANAADARTRKLYEDLYSPKALLQQYKDAGLSPSLMFGGGGPGGTTVQGAQGEGASGIGTQTFGINPVDLSQVKLANAQAENIKADTQLKEVNTEIAEIEKSCNEVDKILKLGEFSLFRSYFTNDNGENESIMDIASKSKNFNTFIQTLRNRSIESNNGDLSYLLWTSQGWKVLQEYYKDYQKFKTDLTELSTKESEQKLQGKINDLLNSEGFAELSVAEQIGKCKVVINSSELTEKQQKAWNNILEEINKESNGNKDLIFVFGMILNSWLNNRRGLYGD